jgi:hypothetical protein
MHSGQAPRRPDSVNGTSQSVDHDDVGRPHTVMLVPTSFAWADPISRADVHPGVLVYGPVTK